MSMTSSAGRELQLPIVAQRRSSSAIALSRRRRSGAGEGSQIGLLSAAGPPKALPCTPAPHLNIVAHACPPEPSGIESLRYRESLGLLAYPHC